MSDNTERRFGRPTTQGCSEQTCLHHGTENRLKEAHAGECPVRSYDGFITVALDENYTGPRCICKAGVTQRMGGS